MKWFLATIVLLVIAYVFDMGLLIYALYAFLGVLLVSRWLTKYWSEHLTATRSCNQLTAEVGEMVTVIIQVKNTGRIPIAWCLIEDLLPKDAIFWQPAKLEVRGKRIALMRLKSQEQRELVYQFHCNRRGYYQIGPLVLETGDFFGLHRRFRVVSEPNYLLVLPPTIELEGYEIASRRPIGEVKMTYRIFEDPTRISGVRQYERGDPLNRINWRATARTGELHSKVYEPSTIVGATILLDFHQGSHLPNMEPFRSELAIVTAASVANAIYEMGQQVGLISNGRDAVDRIREEGWDADARTRDEAHQAVTMKSGSDRLRPVVVPTRKGSEQLTLILESLARLELTDGLSMSQLIVESAHRIPRDASVIVILPSVSPETAIALGNLARQGYAVTAILNVYDVEDFARASGPLLNEGIEVRHLRDESSVREICNRQMMIA